MLTIEEIQRFIDEDRTSEKKMFARKGQAYYDGDHDIKQYRLFYYNADGELVEDKTRSNVKIPHPFFTELVDQAVQYVLSGKDGFVKSNNAELQAELDSYFNQNEDFVAELSEVLTGCMSKGFEYMYAYKNAENRISFMCADSIGVIEVRAKDTDDNTEYVIYWYVDRIEKGHKKIKRIQVWDKDQTYYFVQTDEGKIVEDDSEKLNPKPHTLYKKMNDNNTYYENFGFIPFFRLDNNKKQFSCLKTVKELIDDYDLMASSLSNNLIDFDTPIHVVKGFEGDSLDELQQNLKTKKIIGMESTDTGAGVDIKTVDVPFQARQVKLELDEKNIYRFGMGLNTAGLKDTNATTNIAIKAAYSLLDLKCSKLEIRLKQFLKKILKIGGLQKGTPFCEAACCSTFRVFVPFRPVTEGSQRHSALLRGGGPCECPAFPLQIGAQVVIGQRLWRPAEPYPSGLGGRNSLRLTLTDIGTFIFGDKGEYLQHNIAQKRAHQILPLSGIQQRHVQYHNVNAFFFGQYSPLL